jgi:hypothetical protein
MSTPGLSARPALLFDLAGTWTSWGSAALAEAALQYEAGYR